MTPKQKRPFSTKIDLKLADKLKEDLINQGFSIEKKEYAVFSAKKKGIVCTLYLSGSLVVQGKEKDEFIEFYLEPEILKSFEYTHKEALTDMTPRIGIDEAGKGDFFGPLCVAGIFADESGIKKLIDLGVQDSKKFSDSSILKISKELKKHFTHSIVSVFPEKYNELYKKFLNLNYMLAWGHASAIFNVFEKTKEKNVLIDQFAKKSLVESAVKKKRINVNLKQEHKAESDIVVAAASVLARAAFLEGLGKLGEEMNLKLLKGASSKVIDLGVRIVLKHGEKYLKRIAKIHFKTYRDILNLLI
ncbi:ribonuclease HIII [bacterium]|nr:ribonuclease HIII [bacterium]